MTGEFERLRESVEPPQMDIHYTTAGKPYAHNDVRTLLDAYKEAVEALREIAVRHKGNTPMRILH